MSSTTVVNHSKAGWRISEWGADVGLSRSRVYELLAAGDIKSVKVGNARIIVTAPRDFLSRQQRVETA